MMSGLTLRSSRLFCGQITVYTRSIYVIFMAGETIDGKQDGLAGDHHESHQINSDSYYYLDMAVMEIC